MAARGTTWARRARAAQAATRARLKTRAWASTRSPPARPSPCGSWCQSSERRGRLECSAGAGSRDAPSRRLSSGGSAESLSTPLPASPARRRSPCEVQGAACTSSAQCCQESGLSCVGSVCAAAPAHPGFSGNAPSWWDPNLTLQLDLTEPTNNGGAGGCWSAGARTGQGRGCLLSTDAARCRHLWTHTPPCLPPFLPVQPSLSTGWWARGALEPRPR